MLKQTYTVRINLNALRTMKVVASSPAEAAEKAEQRISWIVGPWTLDAPGSTDEHYTVSDAEDRILDVYDYDGTAS